MTANEKILTGTTLLFTCAFLVAAYAACYLMDMGQVEGVVSVSVQRCWSA